MVLNPPVVPGLAASGDLQQTAMTEGVNTVNGVGDTSTIGPSAGIRGRNSTQSRQSRASVRPHTHRGLAVIQTRTVNVVPQRHRVLRKEHTVVPQRPVSGLDSLHVSRLTIPWRSDKLGMSEWFREPRYWISAAVVRVARIKR
jgi:hypothetical protein